MKPRRTFATLSDAVIRLTHANDRLKANLEGTPRAKSIPPSPFQNAVAKLPIQSPRSK